MHLDFVESLRCPHAHDDGWLVAIPDVVRDRVIWSGEIGCPQCAATWRVHEGVLVLASAHPATPTAPLDASEAMPPEAMPSEAIPPDAVSTNLRSGTTPLDPAAESLRTAALLDLRTPGGAVLLAGIHAHHAAALAALAPDVLVLTLNPATGAPNVHGELRAHAPLPLGVGTLRGARLDAAHADATWLPGALRGMARSARLIAPASVPVPADARELARDEREWVAEISVAASGLVPLRRGGDPLTR